MQSVHIAHVPVGKKHPPVIVGGPCVIESLELLLEVGGRLREVTARYGFPYILKSSFEKANRTSGDSFRGPGLDEGLEIFARVKRELGVPVLTDVHLPAQTTAAAQVVDCLQIPAFLCRQTELIEAAAATNLPVNVKKGQFLSPESMEYAVKKAEAVGAGGVILTERGATFGYVDLVVDMRSLVIMSDLKVPVLFDATHSVQRPGTGAKTGGQRSFVTPLALAAAATGAIDGVFMEVHPQPALALSDADSQLSLQEIEPLIAQLRRVFDAVERSPADERKVHP